MSKNEADVTNEKQVVEEQVKLSEIDAKIRIGEEYLSEHDSVMAGLIDKYGPCAIFKEQHNAFHTIIRTIICQQVQKSAERTYLGRVEKLVSSTVFRPEDFIKITPEQFWPVHLTGRKVSAILDLAKRITSGQLDFAKLAHESDEAVIKALTATKGIGIPFKTGRSHEQCRPGR